jgi:hypothetical protein
MTMACYSGRDVTLTGGGEVSIELFGQHVEASRLIVDGLSEETLRRLDSGGYSEFYENLFDDLAEPEFAGAWLTDFGPEGESVPTLDVRHHRVEGFAPCGTPVTHVEIVLLLGPTFTEGRLQFDARAPSDPQLALGDDLPPTLVGSDDEGVLESSVPFAHLPDPESSGWSDAAVFVQCATGLLPATITVEWTLDPHVKRVLHRPRPRPSGGWSF